MKSLRWWCVAAIAWVYLVSNADEVGGWVRITPFIDEFAVVLAVSIVLARPLQRIPLGWIALAPIPVMLGLKAWLGYPILDAHLAETAIDVAAVALTAVLAAQAGRIVDEFCRTVSGAMFRHLRARPRRFRIAQETMYREVRRSRIRRQPLTLLMIAPQPDSVRGTVDAFIQQAIREAVEDYVQGQIGQLLCQEIRFGELIARQDGRFAAILPGTTPEEAAEIAEQVRAAAREKLGLELIVGQARFPDEEVTLVGLLERAEADLSGQLAGAGPRRSNGEGTAPPASSNAAAHEVSIPVPGESRTEVAGTNGRRPHGANGTSAVADGPEIVSHPPAGRVEQGGGNGEGNP